MLSGKKLKEYRTDMKVNNEELSSVLVRGGMKEDQARAAIFNWQRANMKTAPTADDIENLARV
ncbi:MAG: hypothetical protein GY869_10495, partial [Planctomycetes bacterium]|nr:hypothetical protein [Planctomycetota bacterium]